MADGKKVFLNRITGEVIWRRLKMSAVRYFKADGKACGYQVKANDILNADGILKEFGVVFGKSRKIPRRKRQENLFKGWEELYKIKVKKQK